MEKAVVFGIGNNWKIFGDSVRENYEIIGYIDNNWEALGVSPVDKLPSMEFDKVVIMPELYEEMLEQLLGLGVKEEKIIIYRKSSLFYKRKTVGINCYGQHFDDLIIAAIFGQIGIAKPSYMDIGAHHPYEVSNTALLYQNGCRGINIEANPALIDEFERERPDDKNLNFGVSDKKGRMPFYCFGRFNGRNTFSEKEVEEVSNENFQVKEVVELPVVTLDEVVEKYCPDGFPDYLDCDIEGLDYDVLNGYNFKSNGPKVICVEVRTMENEKFDRMLSGKGYFKFCRIGENNIYVRNEYKNQLCHL